MEKPIISIKNLGKRYLLGLGGGERYRALRDVMANTVKNLFKRKNENEDPQEIWALKDVTFDIRAGEKVGIIGRNGAGKSTLLKILSEITEPTEGEAHIYGRVASLLEVGTGFHPELTGKENIFMNGAILGMRRAEINKKFDEIVAFAEIEKFLDTPVKRYSSGMYVRLAFAVAAHLEPEILLIDEVLAVGDIEFQKKCLGKMGDMSKGGRTILFVSHNMASVQHLCSRAIILNEGKIIMDGSPSKVTLEYIMSGNQWSSGVQVWPNIEKAPGDNFIRVHAVRVLNRQGEVRSSFDVHDPVFLEIEYWVLKEVRMIAAFQLNDETGHLILESKDNLNSPWRDTTVPPGFYKGVCCIPGDFLNSGHISVSYAIVTGHHGVHASGENVCAFSVTDRVDPKGVRGNIDWEWCRAVIRPRLDWTVEQRSMEVVNSVKNDYK